MHGILAFVLTIGFGGANLDGPKAPCSPAVVALKVRLSRVHEGMKYQDAIDRLGLTYRMGIRGFGTAQLSSVVYPIDQRHVLWVNGYFDFKSGEFRLRSAELVDELWREKVQR